MAYEYEGNRQKRFAFTKRRLYLIVLVALALVVVLDAVYLLEAQLPQPNGTGSNNAPSGGQANSGDLPPGFPSGGINPAQDPFSGGPPGPPG
jgi:hypothetical protein